MKSQSIGRPYIITRMHGLSPVGGPICVTKPNFNKIVQWKNENFGGSLFSLITDVLLLTIVLGVFLDIFEPGALLAPLGKIFIR